jgi:hypothetical protein
MSPVPSEGLIMIKSVLFVDALKLIGNGMIGMLKLMMIAARKYHRFQLKWVDW